MSFTFYIWEKNYKKMIKSYSEQIINMNFINNRIVERKIFTRTNNWRKLKEHKHIHIIYYKANIFFVNLNANHLLLFRCYCGRNVVSKLTPAENEYRHFLCAWETRAIMSLQRKSAIDVILKHVQKRSVSCIGKYIFHTFSFAYR